MSVINDSSYNVVWGKEDKLICLKNDSLQSENKELLKQPHNTTLAKKCD